MKKTRILLVLGMICVILSSCRKEDGTNVGIEKTYDHFILKTSQFKPGDDSKVHLDYTDAVSRLLYDQGDVVYVNGHEFTLSKSGSGASAVWTASSSTSVTATKFYFAFADGTIGGTGPDYTFDLRDNIGSDDYAKLLLTGTSDSNVVTLNSACAILRFFTEGASYDYVKVVFNADRIPVRGTMSATSGRITGVTQYLAGVTQGGGGQFLYMTPCNDGVSYYVAIPINGDAVTTTLYLEWQKQGESVMQMKTSGQVTMNRGYVYTVGSVRVSPFTSNGVSSCSFLAGAGKEVLFSAGNLQWQRYRSGSSYTYKWRFAEHQYDVIGSLNSKISENAGAWIDLMGYGTSGSSYTPNLHTTESGDYYAADIAGTNMDWGRYIKSAPGIYYGSKLVTGENWRTLTNDEWSYLIGRSGKCGLATIGGSYRGLILLPDYDEVGSTWDYSTRLPEGPSFTAGSAGGYTTNNLSFDDWSKLEAAGAIFLPATGVRSGTGVSNTDNGYYWSTNIGTDALGKHRARNLQITSSAFSTSQTTTFSGCAVRLVIEIAK